MSDVKAFAPSSNSTVGITAGTSNSTVFITEASVQQVVVTNAGSDIVFIAFGDENITTLTTDGYPILPGSKESLSKNSKDHYIAAISNSAAQQVYVTPGGGL